MRVSSFRKNQQARHVPDKTIQLSVQRSSFRDRSSQVKISFVLCVSLELRVLCVCPVQLGIDDANTKFPKLHLLSQQKHRDQPNEEFMHWSHWSTLPKSQSERTYPYLLVFHNFINFKTYELFRRETETLLHVDRKLITEILVQLSIIVCLVYFIIFFTFPFSLI